MLRPLPKGAGVVAGSKVRAILVAAGIPDVMAKIRGNNAVNQVKATFKALKEISTREEIKEMRE